MTSRPKATLLGAPDIRAMVDDYIESVTDDRLPDGKYHPSSMYGCDRKAIYEVRGVEQTIKPDAKAKRRFYIGHRLHEAVQRTLESHPAIDAAIPEFEVDVPSRNIAGHGDCLILFEGRWWMVEVKSIKKFGVKMGLPKPDHVKQAITYYWCVKNHGYTDAEGWGRNPIPELAGIIMLYVEKEDLNIYQYELTDDGSWDSMVEDKLITLDMFKEDPNSLPPRLPRDPKTGKKNWLCGYCPFADKCWTEDPAIVLPEGSEDW